MKHGWHFAGLGTVLWLLLVATMVPAALAHDHDRIAKISRYADDLLEVLRSDGAGREAPLEAARRLLGDGAEAGEVEPVEPADLDPAAPSSDTPVFATALLAPFLQDVALETGNPGHRELMDAAVPSGGLALVLQGGTFTLASLAQALEAGEQPSLLNSTDEGFRLNIPLVIARSAALLLDDGETLELATARGAFIVNEGLFRINSGVVRGAGTSARVPDFHPFIMTVRGGRAEIERSHFTDLGYDGQPLMSGLSFASSRFSGRKSSGRVIDSVFTNIRSVEATGIADFRFEGNRVEAARGIGVRLEQLSRGAVLDNVVFASGQHGLLMIGSKNVVVAGNVMAENAGRGIFARDGVGQSTIRGNVLVANGVEGISLAGGACVDIFANGVVSNRSDGIGVDQSLGVKVANNLLARNQGAGIAVSNSISPGDETEITGNSFFANVSGISGERFASLLLRGNDFSNQLPVLFAGALQYATPGYLTFMRNHAGQPDASFVISGADNGAPSLFRGNLGQFSLSNFSGCNRGEGE